MFIFEISVIVYTFGNEGVLFYSSNAMHKFKSNCHVSSLDSRSKKKKTKKETTACIYGKFNRGHMGLTLDHKHAKARHLQAVRTRARARTHAHAHRHTDRETTHAHTDKPVTTVVSPDANYKLKLSLELNSK